MQAVCDKMALGLRKVVQKFARTYKESPEGAKSKRLKELKDRLKNVVSSHEVVASEAKGLPNTCLMSNRKLTAGGLK